jgi:DNA end-binding protein Ku
MLDLAKHIVDQKSGHFDPEKFEDDYEKALNELLTKKRHFRPTLAAANGRRSHRRFPNLMCGPAWVEPMSPGH